MLRIVRISNAVRLLVLRILFNLLFLVNNFKQYWPTISSEVSTRYQNDATIKNGTGLYIDTPMSWVRV